MSGDQFINFVAPIVSVINGKKLLIAELRPELLGEGAYITVPDHLLCLRSGAVAGNAPPSVVDLTAEPYTRGSSYFDIRCVQNTNAVGYSEASTTSIVTSVQ